MISSKEFLAKENKCVTLLGMSGVGKTHLAKLIGKEGDWFHFSGDYRIGAAHLKEAIIANISDKMKSDNWLKTLLDNQSISINSQVSFDNLEPISAFLGKVGNPEEKLKLTKLAWETQGVRSVRNDIKVKEKFNFKQSAKDILITSQLRTALIISKKIKATNYQIDTYKKKIYIYGIAITSEERDLVLKEAKEILDVEDIIASIMLVEDLRIQKN